MHQILRASGNPQPIAVQRTGELPAPLAGLSAAGSSPVASTHRQRYTHTQAAKNERQGALSKHRRTGGDHGLGAVIEQGRSPGLRWALIRS